MPPDSLSVAGGASTYLNPKRCTRLHEASRVSKTSLPAFTYVPCPFSNPHTLTPPALDEFGYTLPFAKSEEALNTFVEMQPDGTIANIPSRGLDFLRDYIGRLKGYSPSFPSVPYIAPMPSPSPILTTDEAASQADSVESGDKVVLPASPLDLLQRPKEQHDSKFSWDDFIVPANLALPCNYSRRLIQDLRKERGWPFAGRSVYQVETPAGAT